MRVSYFFLLALLVAGLAACGDSGGPVDLRGTWSGSGTTDTGVAFTLALNVTDVDRTNDVQSVSATATFDSDLENVVTMSGSLSGANLALSSQGGNPFTVQLTLSVSGSVMQGQGSITLEEDETVQLTFSLVKGGDLPPPDGDTPPPPCGGLSTGRLSSCIPTPPSVLSTTAALRGNSGKRIPFESSSFVRLKPSFELGSGR